jgi:hypothetical protein
MFVRTIFLAVLSLFSIPSAVAYDVMKIKQFISDEDALFQITQWHGNDEAQQWSADSRIKYLSVEIDPNQTKIGSPYFSPPLREAAKARCMAVARLALGVATAEEKAALASVMDKATQHHRRQSFDLNNVRFEAVPVLKGPFVTMYCLFMPIGET